MILLEGRMRFQLFDHLPLSAVSILLNPEGFTVFAVGETELTESLVKGPFAHRKIKSSPQTIIQVLDGS